MTNEQLLSEISILMDQKLDEKLDQKLDEKLDQKFDQKLKPIYGRLDGIDGRLDGIDSRLDGIDGRLDGIDDRLDSMDSRLTKVELTQENKILPALNELSATYSSTFKILYEKAQRIDKMESDIEVLKQVTAEHSRMLSRIS